MGKIDLGTVDLAVQEEGVGTQDDGRKEEDNGKGKRGASSARRVVRNLTSGLLQFGKDAVDVVAASCVRVEVGAASIQVGFALGGSFVGLLAKLIDFVVVVIVIVVVVVVIVVWSSRGKQNFEMLL
jgi:hypothetical protein